MSCAIRHDGSSTKYLTGFCHYFPEGGRRDVRGFVASSCTIKARFLDRSSGAPSTGIFWSLKHFVIHAAGLLKPFGEEDFNATKGQLSGRFKDTESRPDVKDSAQNARSLRLSTKRLAKFRPKNANAKSCSESHHFPQYAPALL